MPRSDSPPASYEARLRARLPIYSTRLVRECSVRFDSRRDLRTPEDAIAVLADYFCDKDREEVVVALLDAPKTLIALARVSTGGLSMAVVEVSQVFKAAILANASALIVAHNHPSGNLEPSGEDIRVTRRLGAAGTLLGIPVHDHLIVTADGYTSLAERGHLPPRAAGDFAGL